MSVERTATNLMSTAFVTNPFTSYCQSAQKVPGGHLEKWAHCFSVLIDSAREVYGKSSDEMKEKLSLSCSTGTNKTKAKFTPQEKY